MLKAARITETIKSTLRSGPMEASDLYLAMESRGHPPKSVREAVSRMCRNGVLRRFNGFVAINQESA